MVSRLFSSKAATPIKLYIDTMSQPCRALDIFLKINKLPYEPINVSLGKFEHMTEEFEKLNPFKKVPVMDEGGFILTESVAIFRHLCRKYKVAENWYPKDDVKRARVDEYLEWQHIGVRAPCALYVWAVFFTPTITGQASSPRQVESRKNSMIKACDDLNDVWLKDKPFVAGQEISFADLLAACEVEELILTDYNPREGRPKLAAWLDRVRAETNPYYDEAHERINKLAKKLVAGRAKL
uniref:glutathione transferase n=1 Tax=Lygus hesperus TaxID=30085 RepID=A0A0A9XBW2_LYGHE